MKIKRSKLNQLKFFLGPVLKMFFNKLKRQRKERRQMIQVEKVMKELRRVAKIIKPNNLKINEWVDKYLQDCIMNGKAVNILTQWCVSSMLKRRIDVQGGVFVPTRKERRILQEEIPALLSLFSRNGFKVNWWITFNETFIEADGIPKGEYIKMLALLAKDVLAKEGVIFADWEGDVLDAKSEPDEGVLDDFYSRVPRSYVELRVEQLKQWMEKEAEWRKTDQELEENIKYATACELKEAKLLTFANPMFGSNQFILMPLDDCECYDSFTFVVPDFKKCLVPVLSLCPWRMKS